LATKWSVLFRLDVPGTHKFDWATLLKATITFT
jgi:hypothetical protein